MGAEEVGAGYRQVLAKLAAGEHEAALGALVDLDRAAAGAVPSTSDLERLWRAKLRALRDLLPERPEILVPVLMLHHDVYVLYRERRDSMLAQQARTETEELVEVYVRRADTASARVLAGQVLASLAGYLFDSSMAKPGARLLLGALDYDPKSEVALLALGLVEEKYGRYLEAQVYLRRLLAVAPEHAEGRLRLALTLLRTGGVEAGEKMLAGLPDGQPEWVAQLAAEALAASLTERGKLSEAIAVVRHAAERFPAASRLQIQLSYLLDRTNDRDGALTAAEQAIAVATPGQGDTPRLLYNHWSTAELAGLRGQLQAAATAQLPQLAAALKTGPAR